MSSGCMECGMPTANLTPPPWDRATKGMSVNVLEALGGNAGRWFRPVSTSFVV